MRWTRAALLTRALILADGEVVWSRRPDAGVKFVMMLRITRMMVARKPGHQGELEAAVKTIACGNAG